MYTVIAPRLGRCKNCGGTCWIANFIDFGCDYCGSK